MEEEQKQKKPFYKRWWFIALVAIIVIGAFTGGDEENGVANNNEVETEEMNETVESTEDTQEAEEINEATREEEIRNIIINRTEEHGNYDGFEIEEIRVNENLGDEENDTFIVLVDAIWTRKNTEDTSNDFIEMLSQDISANLHNEGADDVAEVVVFTHDEYNDNDHKYSFEWTEQGFAITEQVIN